MKTYQYPGLGQVFFALEMCICLTLQTHEILENLWLWAADGPRGEDAK